MCAMLLSSATLADAHKASDAYLQIDTGAHGTSVRLDIALRDLEAALDIDTDQDGVPDALEAALGLDPLNPDTNGNGILDGDEDPDGDGLTTRWEIAFGSQPKSELWQWTESAYLPYPGYQPFAGALMDYNGKFMNGQMVLRNRINSRRRTLMSRINFVSCLVIALSSISSTRSPIFSSITK